LTFRLGLAVAVVAVFDSGAVEVVGEAVDTEMGVDTGAEVDTEAGVDTEAEVDTDLSTVGCATLNEAALDEASTAVLALLISTEETFELMGRDETGAVAVVATATEADGDGDVVED